MSNETAGNNLLASERLSSRANKLSQITPTLSRANIRQITTPNLIGVFRLKSAA
ncbi:hypothetical protein [Xenorhabdus khoisanae]|uniref:hypothetical protein n=1 Tax=Xenorhabdus khoisanae TaxID=880157 RepID=UPI0013792A6D|nr:hypothetical protein [Xenorhabdus khoisanae]